MQSLNRTGVKYFIGAGVTATLLMSQGCLATRDWVRENVNDPLSGRITQTEGRLKEHDGQIGTLGTRMTGVEGKLGQFEGRLGQVDAKAERALSAISNLRLERKIVIDMKDGANFAFNSASLPQQAQREIDGFLSDLKGDVAGADGTVFLVAGHTDSVGNEEYNYELGKKRADAVSRYLITKKSMDPMKVIPVSYGQSAPVSENNNAQGRAKNRRVEILVYREGITSQAAAPAAQQPEAPRSSSSQTTQPSGEKITQR
ncbi:MAG TPA: OmpA family protein [Candidatus Limnocylindrales bacterium]|nr:OmpA family protein [Candidatus Limnocylindrales bacterium]